MQWNIHEWSEIYKNEVKYTRMKWNIQECSEIYKNEVKYTRIQWNILEWSEIYVRKFPEASIFIGEVDVSSGVSIAAIITEKNIESVISEDVGWEWKG